MKNDLLNVATMPSGATVDYNYGSTFKDRLYQRTLKPMSNTSEANSFVTDSVNAYYRYDKYGNRISTKLSVLFTPFSYRYVVVKLFASDLY